MTTLDSSLSVGRLVADRPARSRVFERFGIDYCCGGKMPLVEACARKSVEVETVVEALAAVDDQSAENSPLVDAASMGLTELCDHIVQTHHQYLRTELPRLGAMVDRVTTVHGARHPWMNDLHRIFHAFAAEIAQHMMKEEQILFPAIRAMDGGEEHAACFASVAGPISVMELEHDSAGSAMETMRSISDGFAPPTGACNTFRAMLDGLSELELDLHQHVHKENNVLFPRAIEAEAQRQG